MCVGSNCSYGSSCINGIVSVVVVEMIIVVVVVVMM